MDRRQQKTRAAIFSAFGRLIAKKHYHSITVQEIIEEANIGRSTFYAHFETKDELLRALCTDMFDHVFSDDLHSERTHDFSNQNSGLKEKLTHILYHLRDNQTDMTGVLASESGDLFFGYFRGYLPGLFRKTVEASDAAVPDAFIENYLIGSFTDTVRWWIRNGMKETPEQIADCYLTVIEKGVL